MIYLNPILSKKKEKEKQWHMALTDSSESVLPLLIPFWKSKAASGRHSRANVPARRNTSGPLYERETDSEPRRDESTRNKTNQRATATCRRLSTERDRAASTWTSTWTCVPCKNDSDVSAAGTVVGGTRATKVAAARRDTQVRLCLYSFARSLARTARSVARAVRKLLANAWRDETRRMCVAYEDDVSLRRQKMKREREI